MSVDIASQSNRQIEAVRLFRDEELEGSDLAPSPPGRLIHGTGFIPGEVAWVPSKMVTASSHPSHQIRVLEHIGKALCLPAFARLIVHPLRFVTLRPGHTARLCMRSVASFILFT
jgi:hypothetical protein